MYNLASTRLCQAAFLHIWGSNVVNLFQNHSKHYQSQIKLLYTGLNSNTTTKAIYLCYLLHKIYILDDKGIIQNGSQEETSAYNVNHSDCNFEQEFSNLTSNMVKELKNASVHVWCTSFMFSTSLLRELFQCDI